MEKIIQRGAEAVIIKKGNLIIKRRTKKGYRLKIIDEFLRKTRTKKEAKLLKKAAELIPVPAIKKINFDKMEIEMQLINGKKLSDCLDKIKNRNEIAEKIGKQIAILHKNNIIHGDLTTSNIILSTKKEIYFIDFGLGYISEKVEKRGRYKAQY